MRCVCASAPAMKAVKARGAIASSSGARSSPFGFKKNNTFLGRRRETNWFAGEKLDRASASAGALAGATPFALGSGRRAGERAGRRACLQPPCSSSGSVGSGASKMETPGGVVLKAKDIDKDNFASFGQVRSFFFFFFFFLFISYPSIRLPLCFAHSLTGVFGFAFFFR